MFKSSIYNKTRGDVSVAFFCNTVKNSEVFHSLHSYDWRVERAVFSCRLLSPFKKQVGLFLNGLSLLIIMHAPLKHFIEHNYAQDFFSKIYGNL